MFNDERPTVQADIKLTISTSSIIISGPYELRQGGQGIVIRKRILKNDEFWGFIAEVIDMQPIYEIAEQHIAQSLLNIAIMSD